MKLYRIIFLIFLIIVAASILLESCRKHDAPRTTPLLFQGPAHFGPPRYDFDGNPLTEEGFALGKKLFYDGKLSLDGMTSCASCHQQVAAFGTFEHDLSHGVNNQHTTRNAPPLQNLAWLSDFRWDGGITRMEQQTLAHITTSNEMGMNMDAVIRYLREDPEYPALFQKAFGGGEPDTDRLSKALSQFVVMLVSGNAKYDRMLRGQYQFDTYEQEGYKIFLAKCATCHQEPLFTDNSYRNNGLPLNSFLQDKGRMMITGKSEDSLKFRVPSLRNVLLTANYMHDGRFSGLSQVYEHYATGIQQGPTLDPALDLGISLSATERTFLTSFLKTLTDSTFIADKRFE